MIFPQDFVNKIINGDCIEIMRQIPDNSVFTFTDPVYNVGKDYGIYKDNLPDDEYLFMMDCVLSEIKRISTACAIYMPKKWKLDLWNMLGKGFQEIIMPQKQSGAIRYGYSNQFHTILTNARPDKHCQNVWYDCQTTGMGYYFKEKTYGHPGYTSVDISRRVIKYLSKPDDIIFDPYGGTGSTRVAAKNLGRESFMTELNPDYCKIAADRLKQHELFNKP